jgi:hypothetical protein
MNAASRFRRANESGVRWSAILKLALPMLGLCKIANARFEPIDWAKVPWPEVKQLKSDVAAGQ